LLILFKSLDNKILDISISKEFKNALLIYLSLEKFTINENTLHETLNAIYPFIEDHLAIKDILKFEDYRRNYPDRFEWRHFKTRFAARISSAAMGFR